MTDLAAGAPVGGATAASTDRARRGATFAGVFNVVAVGAVRRRPSDVTRLVLWLAVLVLVSLTADDTRPPGATVADLVGDIPSGVQPLLSEVYRWGTFAVVIVAVGTALLRRRWRFALALAATVAAIVGIGLWLADGLDVGERAAASSPYPAVRLAFAVGVVVVAGPHVTRPLRRLLLVVIAVACVGALTSGDALVVDVVGGVALGSAIAAAVHLVIGSPAGTPGTRQVRESLAARGVAVRELRPAAEQVWGETAFDAVAEDGTPLVVSVIGRDETDARLISKVWRTLWYRDGGGNVALTRAGQVEHQAFVLLWAATHRVPVPELVSAGLGGTRDDALLVVTRPEGRRLSDAHGPAPVAPPRPDGDEEGDEVGDAAAQPSAASPPTPIPSGPPAFTDAELDGTWAALASLHEAGLAHGALHGSSVVVGDDGTVTLVGVDRATADAPPARQDLDAVALLVATADAVGPAPSLAAARRALGDERLGELLAMVGLAALPSVEPRRRGAAKQRCAELRRDGAALLGVPEPELTELRRIKPTDIVLAVGTLVGVYLLIGQLADLGSVWSTLTSATIGWVVACALVTQLTSVANAFALIGSVSSQELPLRQTTALQFAYKFTGLVGGTIANLALFTRYLQKRGIGVAVAASSAALTSVAQFLAQTILFVVALLATRGDFTGRIGGGDASNTGGGIGLGTVLIAIIVIGVLVGVVVGVPQVRSKVVHVVRPQWRSAKRNLRAVLANPRRAVLLLGGYLGSQLLFALGLSLALRAYGYHLDLLDFVVINTVASLLGGLAPVPGGMGVIEAGLIAGLTAAGVPDDAAVAATFTYRAFTAYLPPIWGWANLAWLRRRDLV